MSSGEQCGAAGPEHLDTDEAWGLWNNRPNPSGDADVRESEARHTARGILSTNFDFLAPDLEPSEQTEFENSITNAILALTGNASTDRAGTERSEVSPDLPVDWSEKMTPAPQGGGEAAKRLNDALLALILHFQDRVTGDDKVAIEAACGVWASVKVETALAALKPQTHDGEAILREALELIAGEWKVYLGHGDYRIEPALSAEDAQAEARKALSDFATRPSQSDEGERRE